MAGPDSGGSVRDAVWLGASMLLPVPWLTTWLMGSHPEPGLTSVIAGLAILGAAFLLTFAVELAERDIPQSLALLVLALVSVLPEYAVDLHFAIRAAEDPQYAQYAVANMTGANRLLIGLGWSAVVLTALARNRAGALEIDPQHRLEIRFLLVATLYSFIIPLSGTLSLFDAVVLLGLFAAYAWRASKGGAVETELVGPAAWIDSRTDDRGARLWAGGLFVFAAFAIFVSAEPFAEGLVEVGKSSGFDEFLLVQWVAPLASESPEFVVAILFALRYRGSLGIGALISAKVNQWTLLVGALPVAYAIASGRFVGLPLDARQSQELWLTSAQSLLAVLLISELRFTRFEAILLASLFGVQLLFTAPEVRVAFTFLYLAVTAGLAIHSPSRREALLGLMKPRRSP